MATTTIPHAIGVPYPEVRTRRSIFSKAIHWCEQQQENRLFWLGLILALHGCILTPLTVTVVLLSGAGFSLFMLAMVGMCMALVTNLAAMPTKVTIPVFTLSVLMDIVIAITALVSLK
jgi:hypothetical protein